MKITEKQLQMLMVILQDSQQNIIGVFSYDLETRNRLLNEIINQQSDELVEIDELKNQEDMPYEDNYDEEEELGLLDDED